MGLSFWESCPERDNSVVGHVAVPKQKNGLHDPNRRDPNGRTIFRSTPPPQPTSEHAKLNRHADAHASSREPRPPRTARRHLRILVRVVAVTPERRPIAPSHRLAAARRRAVVQPGARRGPLGVAPAREQLAVLVRVARRGRAGRCAAWSAPRPRRPRPAERRQRGVGEPKVGGEELVVDVAASRAVAQHEAAQLVRVDGLASQGESSVALQVQ